MISKSSQESLPSEFQNKKSLTR